MQCQKSAEILFSVEVRFSQSGTQVLLDRYWWETRNIEFFTYSLLPQATLYSTAMDSFLVMHDVIGVASQFCYAKHSLLRYLFLC